MLFRACCQMRQACKFTAVKPFQCDNSIIKPNCMKCVARFKSTGPRAEEAERKRIRTITYYCASAVILTTGLTYAAVPLYRLFCQVIANHCERQCSIGFQLICSSSIISFQSTGYGGTIAQHTGDKVQSMKKINNRSLKIRFLADKGAAMQWNFKPQQYEIKVISAIN